MPLASLLPTPRKRLATLPEQLDLAGGPLPVTVRRNARAKRMILRLAPGASCVVVTAPRQVSGRAIAEFLERHKGWVEERLTRTPAFVAVVDGATISFRGEQLRLVFAEARRSNSFETRDGAPCLMVGGQKQHFARRVADTLKREARADLQAAVDRHARAAGVKPRSLSLKDTKSRWGSCSSDRRLAFSWRIVMAPPQVLDYLAAHEVAHLAHMNHGPDFWALCRELCPEMDAGRDWLKRDGAGLHAIDFSGR